MSKGKEYNTPLKYRYKRLQKRGHWYNGKANVRVGGKHKFTFKYLRRRKLFRNLVDVIHLSMAKLWKRELWWY
jgi:hypothetical protein